MKQFTVSGTTNSDLYIGEQLGNINKYLSNRKTIIITDININKHYSSYFTDYKTIVIGTGESIKSFATIEMILTKLIDYELNRYSFILGVGGGIVTDITGFVASIFMRGIKFGFVSSSLLSQVDASIGGKNGVNFSNYKNMIGTFSQPEFVICDLSMLKTLPSEEFIGGLSEIIKHTLIADNQMFSYVDKYFSKIIEGDIHVIEKLVTNSVMIKAEIVNLDEKEKGERQKLNFGHTFAHAIELNSNISHGKAVSIGIVYAAKISNKLKYITDSELNKIITLLQKFNLPTHTKISNKKLLATIKKDKKRENNNINFILLNGIGNAIVEKLSFEQISEFI